jgi:hypothetical protein
LSELEEEVMIRLDPGLSFFMTRNETETLFKSWLAAHKLHCVLCRWFPFEYCDYHSDGNINVENYQEAMLDLAPFLPNASNQGDLIMANRECLHLDFPIETDSSLIMGELGSLAHTGPRAKLWSSLAKQLCSVTKDGIWFRVNDQSEFLPAKKLRYSEEARKMHKNGIRLRASSGTVEYFPDKPSTMT